MLTVRSPGWAPAWWVPGLAYGEALAGALNVVVVAWLSLGAAVLALGWTSRAVALIGAMPVGGGFLIWVLADLLDWPDWVRRLSPFTHVAPVPAAEPNWAAQAAMLAVAALLLAVGLQIRPPGPTGLRAGFRLHVCG